MGNDLTQAPPFTIPAGLAFRALDILRLAHIYALKDSHPDELPDDFKSHKWTDEVEFAERSADVYREMITAMESASQPADGRLAELGGYHSDRGFAQFPEIDSSYGGSVRAYESSAAEAPHVWLKVVEIAHDTIGKPYDATAHLTLESAKLLRDQLDYLIEHHYQLR